MKAIGCNFMKLTSWTLTYSKIMSTQGFLPSCKAYIYWFALNFHCIISCSMFIMAKNCHIKYGIFLYKWRFCVEALDYTSIDRYSQPTTVIGLYNTFGCLVNNFGWEVSTIQPLSRSICEESVMFSFVPIQIF